MTPDQRQQAREQYRQRQPGPGQPHPNGEARKGGEGRPGGHGGPGGPGGPGPRSRHLPR
jgi:hypothetical protein